MKTWCLVVGLSLLALGCGESGSGGRETGPQASPETGVGDEIEVPGAAGGSGLSGSGPVGGPGPTGTGITP